MSVMRDPAVLNEWVACAYPGEVAPGGTRHTKVLGQPIRLSCATDGALTARTLQADGTTGRPLPVVEKFMTVFTNLGDDPRPLPEIPEFDEPGRAVVHCGGVGVNASPYRVIENFLDMAHFCFVHTGILGTTEQTEVYAYKSEIRRDADEVWATDCRFFQPTASKAAGGGQTSHYRYRVMSPFSVMLYKTVFGDEAREDVICLFVQPLDEVTCRAYPPMALVDSTSTAAAIVEFQQKIFLQDRIILENQRPKLLPLAPHREIPTRADLSSMAFRRWLKEKEIRFGILQEAG